MNLDELQQIADKELSQREKLAHCIFVCNAAGKTIEDHLDPAAYRDYIGEAVEPWTYLKFPYYKPDGYPDGIYRVGPLARLNIADSCGTPLADQESTEFRELERGPVVLSSFYYHYARLIEILYSLEKTERLPPSAIRSRPPVCSGWPTNITAPHHSEYSILSPAQISDTGNTSQPR